MLGAYGVAMATRFNGFGEVETIACDDAPMGSMFGLAPRSIPSPKTDTSSVIKLTRAKGKKRRRR